MKTQITIETTPEQELVIGLTQTGRLQHAKRAEIKDYFEATVGEDLFNLDAQVKALLRATEASESEVKGA